jgi:hypothetical protein
MTSTPAYVRTYMPRSPSTQECSSSGGMTSRSGSPTSETMPSSADSQVTSRPRLYVSIVFSRSVSAPGSVSIQSQSGPRKMRMSRRILPLWLSSAA